MQNRGQTAAIGGVPVIYWNPRSRHISIIAGKGVRIGRRVNNFGDLIGPRLVRHLQTEHESDIQRPANRRTRLLTVGSILHFARDGDTIWGTGVNGKLPASLHRFQRLDVRSVRGPLTGDFLSQRGIAVPEVYGDPGLLIPQVFPQYAVPPSDRSGTLLVMNLNDVAVSPTVRDGLKNLDPRADFAECIRTIASSAYVVSTSLHGVVIAEAYGVPARLVISPSENPFKYEDYFLGTGRSETYAAKTIAEALNDRKSVPPPIWSVGALMSAFPFDLWRYSTDTGSRRSGSEYA